MSVLFIHPPVDAFVSGGNRYNQHIIHQAQKNHYPLYSLPIAKARLKSECAAHIERSESPIVIFDSLFLDFVAQSPPPRGAIFVLLLHYLPSMNPSIPCAERQGLSRIENTAISNCERIIVTGSGIFQALSQLCPDKSCFLCRPGVDGRFRPRAVEKSPPLKSRLDLISVANLVPDKGYPELLEALTALQDDLWNWHIVGSVRAKPAFVNAFKKCADRAGVLSNIRFHGVLDTESLADLVSQMDLFVNASRYESYGMATAEAVASGLPVVSTRSGDAADLIEDGENGLIVPVANALALQNAIHELMRSPALREKFRRRNRKRSCPSWEGCFENFKQACGQGSQ